MAQDALLIIREQQSRKDVATHYAFAQKPDAGFVMMGHLKNSEKRFAEETRWEEAHGIPEALVHGQCQQIATRNALRDGRPKDLNTPDQYCRRHILNYFVNSRKTAKVGAFLNGVLLGATVIFPLIIFIDFQHSELSLSDLPRNAENFISQYGKAILAYWGLAFFSSLWNLIFCTKDKPM